MTLALYGHPFSSYTQKALIALYENAIAFEFRIIGPAAPENYDRLKRAWSLAKFPLLEEDGTNVFESTSIIEYLHLKHPGPVRLIPNDGDAAVETRTLDRVFDNYVMTPMNAIVRNAMRAEEDRDPSIVTEARAQLEAIYGWLDQRMATRKWAIGEVFTLADCAAAPSLFYADWAHPIAPAFVHLRNYRQRLLARPSYDRANNEARPYRHYFPLGAPDRD
ncbi:glutathione S-transferase family protein [Bradyrhizobium sp.]|uniref:glutathione S-transferase family protein n=1 Tax=Bradyrhizobium sp. TaxID=376 RepID=UPI002D63BF13|nr:glutathione S-transferase family protein [Bradyrhizobium sp.]HZR74563.1 glutathione S-transferase family protein [Bradyrhizobium sp.]